MKSVVVLLLGVFFSANVFGSELIVKLKGDHQPEELKRLFVGEDSFESEVLVPDLNLHLVKLKTQYDAHIELNILKDNSVVVEYVQLNHTMKRRMAPNDASFTKQWSVNDKSAVNVGAQAAWEISTGGFDRLGNALAMAVVDGGFDIAHPDLVDNVWVNKLEVAGNGKDDDGNGYIDDINGWNATTNSGKISLDDHGTHVSGILGAKSNNSLGIAGLNWKTKIVVAVVQNATTAEVARAYGYVYEQKKLWISSKGTKGVNIVVTNSSFGIDKAKCDSGDYPVWNDLFNKMGTVGILSAAAVPNEGWDIDVVGDVPSGCSSEYVIAVTNHGDDGKLATDLDPWTGKLGPIAGYGLKTVDIGSPGQKIHSSVIGGYDTYSGTSMATPHVTGTVGLMYASASEKLINEYYVNPSATALKFKGLLLTSAKKTTDFAKLVSSGGRLDLLGAMTAASSY